MSILVFKNTTFQGSYNFSFLINHMVRTCAICCLIIFTDCLEYTSLSVGLFKDSFNVRSALNKERLYVCKQSIIAFVKIVVYIHFYDLYTVHV